jgi:hypothetical protein
MGDGYVIMDVAWNDPMWAVANIDSEELNEAAARSPPL